MLVLRSSWRRALGLVVAAAACLLAVLLPASPAAAHATLISTDPAEGAVLERSPGEATFTFDERVSLPAGAVRVFDAEGQEVDSSARGAGETVTVDLPDELADGTDVVAWRVVSADGHPVAGSLSLSVGRPSLQVATPSDTAADDSRVRVGLSVAHGLSYAGLLLAVGVALFVVLLLPASVRPGALHRRLRRVAGSASLLAVVAWLVALPFIALDQQGLGLGDLAGGAAWSGVPGWGWVSLGVLVAGLALLRRGLAEPTTQRGGALTGVGAAAAVVSPALTGHSRAYDPQWAVVVTDVVHVLAGSVWLGGLVGLAVTLPAIAGARRDAALVLTRWSVAAAAVLVVLLGTGSLLAWRILGSWDALLDTTYGRLLLAKVALVATAVAIAAWNRLRFLPRARDDSGHERNRASAQRLSRVVSVEAAVLVAVLGVTGFLVNQAPVETPQQVPGGRTGVELAAMGDDVKVLVTLAPGEVGRNRLSVQLQDLTGEPFEPARLPVVSLRSDGLDLGRVSMRSEDAGTWVADVVVPDPGEWRVQVSLQLGRFDNPVAVLAFDVPG